MMKSVYNNNALSSEEDVIRNIGVSKGTCSNQTSQQLVEAWGDIINKRL